MAASVMASVSLKPSPFTVEKSAVRGLPSLARTSSSFKVQASGGKKIKTDTPYGTYTYSPFCLKLIYFHACEFDNTILSEKVLNSNLVDKQMLKLYVHVFDMINKIKMCCRNRWWHELEGWVRCLWEEA